jgi:hypothetical protein
VTAAGVGERLVLGGERGVGEGSPDGAGRCHRESYAADEIVLERLAVQTPDQVAAVE